jgi:hypothetical protein
MTGSNKQNTAEFPNTLQSHGRSKSRTKSWLSGAVSATVNGLGLKSIIEQPLDYDQLLTLMDEAKLCGLIGPLPLSRPLEVFNQMEKSGGLQNLSSQKGQLAIASWGIRHRAVQVLQELSETTSMLMATHEHGQLKKSGIVLRSLAMLGMIAFIPGTDILRRDLATILKGSPENMPGLIKSFRNLALIGDDVVVVVNQRVQNDSIWSTWTEHFLNVGIELETLHKVSNYPSIAEPEAPITNPEEGFGYNSLDDALLTEFFSIIASIATRLTKDSLSPKNKGKIHQGEGVKP